MIPNNVVGLVLFAASLGPGYLFVRIAERHDPRADRSALVEAVEMVSVGALASLVAGLIVLLGGDAVGAFEPRRVAKSPPDYLTAEPVAGLTALLVLFLLAYLVAALSAHAVHWRTAAAHIPGTTGWWETFRRWRPTPQHVTVLTVELRDGRKVAGVLRSFTSQHDDNRELVLATPIGVQAAQGGPVTPTHDEFLILREQDLLYVSGRYIEGRRPTKRRPRRRRRSTRSREPDRRNQRS